MKVEQCQERVFTVKKNHVCFYLFLKLILYDSFLSDCKASAGSQGFCKLFDYDVGLQ